MFLHKTVTGNPGILKNQVLRFINEFPVAVFLDSNRNTETIPVTGIRYDFLAAAGVHSEITAAVNNTDEIQNFLDTHKAAGNWVFGYISYDYKNKLERLTSSNPDNIGFPLFHFFVPEILIYSNGNDITVVATSDAIEIWNDITGVPIGNIESEVKAKFCFTQVPEHDHYLNVIKKLLLHIQRGDIYEINFCHRIEANVSYLEPLSVFSKLTSISPNPFSCFYRLNDKYLMSASPERFVTRRGDKLITQPMKGTAARLRDENLDKQQARRLSLSEKERSENIMIVDLVRNDLSKVAEPGTVKMEELCGVYSFSRSHQMISTVSCKVKKGTTFTDILKALFPMGSMTGAPKISAMNIIDEVEDFRRCVFSGTVGYIRPDGDFDFNVVIRSVLFNETNGIVSAAAGGAITAASNPEKEFAETMIKLAPQMEALGMDEGTLLNIQLNDKLA